MTEMPTDDELRDIGRAVLNIVTATMTLGHVSPAYTLDYIHPTGLPETFGPLVARDIIAWSSKRGDWRDAEMRLRRYVGESGWQRASLERMAKRLMPNASP